MSTEKLFSFAASSLCRPSVNLGRRTTAARSAVHPLRSGRLPVFAVSEPSPRVAQDALPSSARSSRYRGPGSNTLQHGVGAPDTLAVLPSSLGGRTASVPRLLKPSGSAREIAHQLA